MISHRLKVPGAGADMDRNSPKEFAIILNQNAHRVTQSVLRSAQRAAPHIALYTSRTKEEGYQIIKEVLDRGYRRIICGGGDGTLVHVLSEAKKYLEQKNARLHEMGHHAREGLSRLSLPELGILKLGTGNSLAPILGSKGGLTQLSRLAQGEEFKTQRINLIESEDRCFTFCGLGWDAQILNDYVWLKEQCRPRLLSRIFRNLLGYLAAIAFRTIPKVLLARKHVVATARNLGQQVYRVRSNGDLEPIRCEPGEIFYTGPCHVIGAATTPYYGYRLKAFPDAMKMPGYMQVRVIKAGVGELLSHMPTIWQGTYKSPNFVDFLVEKVHFAFSETMPLQIGGDAEGYRKELALEVSETTVDFLDFSNPVSNSQPTPTA
jgi:diacylglycerol kinase family enzyme